MAAMIQLSVTTICHAEAFSYIPNSGDGTVSIIKVLDNSVTGSVSLGGSPFGVAVGEDYIYVTNETGGNVSVISMTYNTVIDLLATGTSPRGIAISSDEAYIYVANYSDNTLSVINASAGTSETITIGGGPVGVAMSPNDDYVYVTNSEDDSLSIISAETNELFGTLKNNYYLSYINSTDDVAFNDPYGIAISPSGYYIYVVNNNNGGEGALSILYAGTVYSEGEDFDWSDYDPDGDEGPYSLYEPITVGNDPRGVAVDPDNTYIYVTNYADDTVSVVSFSSKAVTKTISVGDGPYGISVTPSGDFVYVVNQLSNNVSVIDTSDNTVVDTVDVGSAPVGFGKFTGGKPPRTPSSLSATKEKTTTIEVTWSDNSDDELGFKLYRKKYIGGSYSLVATLDANVTEYTDSGLGSDANYYYRVCAYNYAGSSDYSNVDYATTGNNESGCFIATAAYGSIMEPHVQVLRDFRDRFLSTNAIGKGFLHLYYTYSPPVADFIRQHDGLRFIIRWTLMPFVGISWLYLSIGAIPATMTMGSFIFIAIFTITGIKRQAERGLPG